MRHLKARLINKVGFGPMAAEGLTVGNIYSVFFDDVDPYSCRSVNVPASWGLLGLNWKLQMDGIELREEQPVIEDEVAEDWDEDDNDDDLDF